MRKQVWQEAIKVGRALGRPPWRTVVPAAVLLLGVWGGHAAWQPGRDVRDGRHDQGRNGIWLQHGWLGHDSWFVENNRTERRPFFRRVENVRELARAMRERHIRDVFPHLCPTLPSGEIMPVDDAQTQRLLREFQGLRVLPWVGGVRGDDVDASNPARRKAFVRSVQELLRRYPEMAGVHLNVEPWPTGDQPMLRLLDEIRGALPKGKLLSVAAYPPPTRWHPYPEVHWDEAYFKAVARRVDQMAVMQYDTGLRDGKLYQNLMRTWTEQVLTWARESGPHPPTVLLGVPTYDDAGVGYHNPAIENLENALRGIHVALDRSPTLPPTYQGVAVYSEWETEPDEWQHWHTHFAKP